MRVSARRALAGTTSSPPNGRLHLKLLALVAPSVDKAVHVWRRLHAYHDTFELVERNRRSAVKAANLHVLLWSRFCTTRALLGGDDGSASASCAHGDALLNQQLKALTDGTHATRHDFELAYAAVLEGLKPGGAAAPYIELTRRFFASCSHGSSAPVAAAAAGEAPPQLASAAASPPAAPLTAEELEQFYFATSETDILVVEKIEQDVARFVTGRERVVAFLRDWQAASGWITAAGVSVLALLTSMEA